MTKHKSSVSIKSDKNTLLDRISQLESELRQKNEVISLMTAEINQCHDSERHLTTRLQDKDKEIEQLHIQLAKQKTNNHETDENTTTTELTPIQDPLLQTPNTTTSSSSSPSIVQNLQTQLAITTRKLSNAQHLTNAHERRSTDASLHAALSLKKAQNATHLLQRTTERYRTAERRREYDRLSSLVDDDERVLRKITDEIRELVATASSSSSFDGGRRRRRLTHLRHHHEKRRRTLADRRRLRNDLAEKIRIDDELITAAVAGDETTATSLLSKGGSVNAPDPNAGISAFAYACGGGHVGVVTCMLERGDADVNYNGGGTAEGLSSATNCPLIVATRNRHRGVVEVLLKTGGVDLEVVDEAGRTALLVACYRSSRRGGDESRDGDDGRVRQREYYDIASALIRHGANVNACDKRGDTGLHICAAADDFEIATLLLENGADQMMSNRDSFTPFSIAAAHRHEKTLRALHEHRRTGVAS